MRDFQQPVIFQAQEYIHVITETTFILYTSQQSHKMSCFRVENFVANVIVSAGTTLRLQTKHDAEFNSRSYRRREEEDQRSLSVGGYNSSVPICCNVRTTKGKLAYHQTCRVLLSPLMQSVMKAVDNIHYADEMKPNCPSLKWPKAIWSRQAVTDSESQPLTSRSHAALGLLRPIRKQLHLQYV